VLLHRWRGVVLAAHQPQEVLANGELVEVPDVTLVLDTHPTHVDNCWVKASVEKLCTLDLKHVPTLYMTQKWELKTKEGGAVQNGLDRALYPNEDLPNDDDTE